MIMTDYEIKRSYLEAKYPENQIAVLADLNLVSRIAMENKIASLGIDIVKSRGADRKKRVICTEEAIRLVECGLSDNEIATKIGCRRETVTSWRERHGIRKR